MTQVWLDLDNSFKSFLCLLYKKNLYLTLTILLIQVIDAGNPNKFVEF